MNELLSGPAAYIELGDSVKAMLTLIAMSTLRVYALFMIFPPTQDQSLQGPVRNGLCLTIGTYISWGQPLHAFEGMSMITLAVLLIKEVLIGLMLGFAAAIVFWVAAGVGALIDNVAGFNNQQLNNPLSGEQSTPVSNLMEQLACSLFWMLGGAVVLVGALFQSYHWWPLAKLTLAWSAVLEDFAAVHLLRYMEQTVTIAAPLLLVLMLIDLGFGIIARTADRLEPNSMSQPVRGAVATLMLALLIVLFFQEAQPTLTLQQFAKDIQIWTHGVSVPR